MKRISILMVFVLLGLNLTVLAQKNGKDEFADKEYWAVVSGRAGKIVETMKLGDEAKEKEVQDLIAAQYYRLNGIHDGTEAEIKKVKESDLEKAKKNQAIEKLNAKRNKELDKLHKSYLKELSKELTPEQVEAVKNGMTYSVCPNTYAAYQDMLPNLTVEQKKYILDALTEAREKAMDAGSSKEKHAWFGKYKGRINNYLSKQGYDMNKESKAWQERLKKEGIEL
ncbi:DUF3826 domain-containing protein [Mangrovibacterium diazotrophicum]|uniref:Uncharacterized protein DUF3826 n=1 Tax=Mangrovibacterium diazotrophicum TaxID=1261403 RepID=A0A419W494_9BACT|nr:DUF3826 domain-containing protein [Mangrovibacterium diazotrophicum]RKD90273.1 uncharacterized protein DUF3826 [Mangrovibacterium diazotrophicum]